MSNFSQPAFRDRRIRWLDEEMDAGHRYTSTRDELNDELIANERSHFDHFAGGHGEPLDELFDMTPMPAPATSVRDFIQSPLWDPSPTPSVSAFEQPPPYTEQLPTTSTSMYPTEYTQFPMSYDTRQGYMEQPSAFQLDVTPTETTFLECFPKGNATLTYQNDGELVSIREVNLDLIESRSSLLRMAFEHGRSGPQLHLETLTSGTAYPFLRYLYTGSYALRSLTGEPDESYEDVPTSVLFHCQLYRLAAIYDMLDLKSQAYVNVLRQCEFGCSSPDKPIDLCAAIRFIYEHLRDHDNLIDAIVNYCVSCFLQHRLAEDSEFKKLAYELRPFHQALCKNSLDRGFQNDTASAIVQMPFKPYTPVSYASREDLAATRFDHVFHFHATDRYDQAAKKRRRSDVKEEEKAEVSTTLPIRPREDLLSELNEPFTLKEVQLEDDEDYESGSKRRAPSNAKQPCPILSGISQLRAAESGTSVAEPEFDIVEHLDAAIASQDSDSESDDFVKVKSEVSAAVSTLPIRTVAPSTSAVAKSEVENDSDSEWSMI